MSLTHSLHTVEVLQLLRSAIQGVAYIYIFNELGQLTSYDFKWVYVCGLTTALGKF